jgi:hypothetical protein
MPSSTGPNSYVYTLTGSGSDLYAGGDFSSAGGVTVNYIAKWNGNNWSALGSGMNSGVVALARAGTDLYAGGAFTNAGGIAANYIAKWNGSRWSALGSGLAGGDEYLLPVAMPVVALAVSGTDVYAGGSFTNAGGLQAKSIAKWDGTRWAPLGSGTDGYVRALAVSGSDVYVGGRFRTAGGIAADNVAKWNGSSWSALGADIPNGSGRAYVTALAVSGSDLYAGVYLPAGEPGFVAKWDGSNWSLLNNLLLMGPEGNVSVSALALSGSDLYVGGGCTLLEGARCGLANFITKWDGTGWSALGSGVSEGAVLPLALSGSDLYVGGTFATVGGKVSQYIGRAYLPTLPDLLRGPNRLPVAQFAQGFAALVHCLHLLSRLGNFRLLAGATRQLAPHNRRRTHDESPRVVLGCIIYLA